MKLTSYLLKDCIFNSDYNIIHITITRDQSLIDIHGIIVAMIISTVFKMLGPSSISSCTILRVFVESTSKVHLSLGVDFIIYFIRRIQSITFLIVIAL